MRRVKLASAALGLIIGVLAAVPANAWEREGAKNKLEVYAYLTEPAEGLAVASDGKIYAASAMASNLFVIPATGCPGCTVETLAIKCSNCGTTPIGQLLGVGLTPTNGRVLVVDSGGGRVLNVGSDGGASVYMSLPASDGRSKDALLNAIAFDTTNIYVSDSANGMIWIMNRNNAPGVATPWIQDDLLKPATGLLPPFGANGLAFAKDGSLLVANTANRNIIQIPVAKDGTAGPPSIFVTGINGPDGIARHPETNNIWVTANMSDEIVVVGSVSKTALAKLGDFKGLATRDGLKHPVGLLFPTNLAFTSNGSHVYIANPAFKITGSIVEPYANLVTSWTISRMESATLPDPPPQ
jgi:DNA-binding beta-propeller fold protein YncE